MNLVRLYLIVLSLSIATAACGSKINDHDLKKVSNMKCYDLTKEELKDTLDKFSDKYKYKIDKDSEATVKFQFNLDPSETDESIFAVLSRTAKKFGEDNLLYVGPYKTNLTVPIDDRLMTASGYHDNVEFRLLQVDKSRYCRWANSLEYPYWKPNSNISIDFLYERRIDEEGLVFMFDVEIR